MPNTVANQPNAVSLQLTDYLLLWQGAQSPPTRREPVSGLAAYYLALTGGTVTGDITFSAAKPKITGNAGTVRAIQLLTGSTVRWQFDANATAETGTNAGSDLELWSYTDAGAQLTKVLAITRSSGAVALTGALSVSVAGTSGNQVVNFSQFTQSVAGPGYITLPGGVIIQWGTATSAFQDFTINFPLTFPTGAFSVVAVVQNTSFTTNNAVAISGQSAAGFSAHTAGNLTIDWMAIGH